MTLTDIIAGSIEHDAKLLLLAPKGTERAILKNCLARFIDMCDEAGVGCSSKAQALYTTALLATVRLLTKTASKPHETKQ